MTSPEHSHNPTAVSATLGHGFSRDRRANGTVELVKGLIMPVLLSAFATYLVVGIVAMEVPEGTSFPGPGFFPGLIAAGLYVFSALLVVAAVRQKGRDARAAAAHEGKVLEGGEYADASVDADRSRVVWSSLAWVVLGFIGFAVTLSSLGWVIGAAALFWCVARGFGERRHLLSAVVGLTASSVAYIAFDMMLGLSLPSGVLGWRF